ncbi:hypothetical protein PV327_006080 [Microctonus hyperodae]|uniref:Uncharacterized protein n=1 Tax=Microctonus hyperodae TaxID=165561 RepID=A0AA39G477_MICHY|nr:hypothetical protein PV327_006080 [Microctonus hyperodae]
MNCKVLKIFLFLMTLQKSSEQLSTNIKWGKNIFDECNQERQPVVEYYYQNGMQYLFFSQRVTWVEARMLCRSYNSRLAILDTIEKALGVAQSISQSNIVMEDTWLGGRKIDSIWYWIDKENNKSKEIPTEPNVEDYPPWIREPRRLTKECLAIDRRSHEHPNFVDLDCRLQRPFIYAGEIITNPVPSKWVRINKNTFTLYHGRVTWQEAATFCRAQGARLAILKSTIVIRILANSMTKTRPDFETVWIGGHYSYGRWVWMATGSILNSFTDESGFPPWRFGRAEKNDGCLLLDRHIDDNSSFIEMSCDRKRDFVCEEYSDDEENDWIDEPIKFSYENNSYIIYASHKTWMKSQIFCNERGSVLAHVEHMNAINWIIDAMGDHPKEISHVWLGGRYNEKTNEWRWIGNGELIPKQKNRFGYPPWAHIEGDIGNERDNSYCLNLDRTDHVKSHIYGLDCNSKQSFVCKITCDIPPLIKNGTWDCRNVANGRQCLLQCDQSLIMMGIKNVTCTFKNGWISGLDLTEFPICLQSRDYLLRLLRSLSQDIRKSSGYYIILDHPLSLMKSLSIKFAQQFLTAFPMSNSLKSGLISYISDPPVHLSFNQTDTCAVLSVIHSIENNLVEKSGLKVDINKIHHDISIYNGRRVSIIIIIDSARGVQYIEALQLFKAAGHHIIVIGLREDWEMLLPLATIGFDRRINLFLFERSELEHIINELHANRKKTKCLDDKDSMLPDHIIYKSSTSSITESYSSITIPTNKVSTTIPQSMNPNMSFSLLTFPNFPTSQSKTPDIPNFQLSDPDSQQLIPNNQPKIPNVSNFQLQNPNLQSFIPNVQSKIPNIQNFQPHISNTQPQNYQTEFMDFKELPESRFREVSSTPKIIDNGYEDGTIYHDWISDNATQQLPAEKFSKKSSTNISQSEFDD